MRRKITLGLLCTIFLAVYAGQARLVETLRLPKPAHAATVTTVEAPPNRKAQEKKKPKVTKKTNSLGNGDAYSDSEIKAILKKTPNGEYFLPHYKAVGTACRKWNVNPLLVIGMFQMECNLGKREVMVPSGSKLGTKSGKSNNFGNLRRNSKNFKPSGTPPIGYIQVGGGPHAVFRTSADGINAYCWTIRSVYLDHGRDDLNSIIKVYAPKEDRNDPAGYVAVVKRVMKNAAK